MKQFDPLQTVCRQQFNLLWQMTLPERLVLISVLQHLKPELSVEVGTHLGGSLQVLSHFSTQVISIDLDPETGERLAGRFDNVEFVSGDSEIELPKVLVRVQELPLKLEFALIDGRHSREGVRQDLLALLEAPLQSDLLVLVHDSANPACRSGISSISWQDYPHVHYVELDFVPGIFRTEPLESDQVGPNSLWGGFACIRISSTPRSFPLPIAAGYEQQFEALQALLVPAPPDRPRRSKWSP